MKNFEELAFEWYDTICFSDKYAYRTEKMNAIKHLVSFFGKMNCEAIKSADVDRFIKYESEHLNPNNGKPYSKKIMIDHISIGNNIFEYALDNEMIDCRNPFQRKRKRIPKNAPVHQRTPIEDTHKELILRVYHQAQVAAVIMLYCGLRRGELIALEWSDIDLFGKQIAVIKSAERINSNAFTVTAHTKNGKDRYIPIPDNIIPFLKLERFNSCGKTLVCSQKCGKMHTESSWKRMWDSYQSRLNYQHYCDTMRQLGRTPQGYTSPTGIPQILDRFTAHQLRHTYCTMLYHAGVDLKSASQLMGHSDIKITLEIYTHLDEKFKKINIDKFNRYIANDKTNQVYNLAQVL